MGKHTPGPWKVGNEAASIALVGNFYIRKDDDSLQWIADVMGSHVSAASRGEIEANAHLIASAPDLLAALEKIVEMNLQHAKDQYGDRNEAERWGCVVIARTAIAKAKGGQP